MAYTEYRKIYDRLKGNQRTVADQPGPKVDILQKGLSATLIDELGLAKYRDKKITLQDVMKVGDSIDLASESSGGPRKHRLKDHLRWLKGILLLNFKSRDKNVPTIGGSADDESEENEDELSDEDEEKTCIHPLDFIVLLYPFCDVKLQMSIARKLFLCRLAIPFVIPNYESMRFEIFLTQLNNVNIEFFSAESKTSFSAMDARCRSVSVIKFDRLSKHSKSGILNSLINDLNDSKHPTFVHWDVEHGSEERRLSNGLIEISWKITEKSGNTRFLNLRGDSIKFPHQVELMTKFSNIFLCVIQFESLNNTDVWRTVMEIPSSIPIIFLVLTDIPQKDFEVTTKEFADNVHRDLENIDFFMHARNISMQKTLSSLNGKLIEKLKGLNVCEALSQVSGSCFKVDLNSFQTETHFAESLIKKIKGQDMLYIKEKVLPLQGNHWHEWCKLQKKLHRDIPQEILESGQLERETRAQLEEDMQLLRKKQQDLLGNLSPVMDLFLTTMHQVSEKLDRSVFLQFLSIGLNRLNQSLVPQLRFTRNNLLSKTTTESETFKIAEHELESSTLKLELFFRELGQVYEAGIDSLNAELYSHLPATVASLVIGGHPLEMLDGDGSNIPMIWLKQVLQGIKQQLGNKTVMVLSVIGVESSGKSTLLNTMFGLQFGVSAGRCTKGAYMQLVEADKSLPFDYVLVLDTEGLSSGELQNQETHRDNELATFVIGIGDVTIVNIKGENYSQMKDFFQIAVTAFCRMSQVHKRFNASKRCIFIHQNVSSPDAGDMNFVANKKLQSFLDEITEEAAIGARLLGVQFFNQLISFESDRDTFYFPDFWQGNPPMAHVNPLYSANVLTVRQNIFSALAKKPMGSFQNFDIFSKTLNDLWSAILDENFAFCFKNFLEVGLHSELEHEQQRRVSEIKCEFRMWQNEFTQTLNLPDLNHNCADSILQSLIASVETKCISVCETYTRHLQQFCDKHKHSAILCKWLPAKLALLQTIIRTAAAGCIAKMQGMIENARIVHKIKISEHIHKNDLMKKAFKLAEKWQQCMYDETAMQRDFSAIWVEFEPSDDDSLKIENVAGKVEATIMQCMHTFAKKEQKYVTKALKETNFTLDQKNEETAASLDDFVLQPHHLSVVRLVNQERVTETDKDFIKCCTFVQENLKSHFSHGLIKESSSESGNYDITDCITTGIADVSKWASNELEFDGLKISILPELQAKVCIVVCQISFPKLCQLYLDAHGIRPIMKKYKEELYNFFKGYVQLASIENILLDKIADTVEDLLEVAIIETIYEKVSSTLQENIVDKQSLISLILKCLANKAHFSSYLVYFDSPKEAAINALTEFIQNIVDSDYTYMSIGKNIKTKITSELESIPETDEANFKASLIMGKLWIQLGQNVFKRTIVNDLEWLPDSWVIEDQSRFMSLVTEKITGLIDSTIDRVKNKNMKELKLSKDWIYNYVENVWGCPAVCPFCDEPCCRSAAGHYENGDKGHKCLQHRPLLMKLGRKYDSKSVLLSSCNNIVCQKKWKFQISGDNKEHKYANYHKYYPEWEIEPTPETSCSKYWQWFAANYKSSLEKHYKICLPKIPSTWFEIPIKIANETVSN